MKKFFGKVDTSNIKRCYLSGADIEIICPKCGATMIHCFDDQYLMYPVEGSDDTAIFVCDPCNNDDGYYSEWELPIKIISTKMEIHYDPKTLKEHT